MARNLPSETVTSRISTSDSTDLTNGGVQGVITVELDLATLKVSGPVWHVNLEFIIDADDDSQDFTADVSGTLHTETGQIKLNGNVTDGWLAGAQMHVDAQVVSDAFDVEGTIRIMAGSAD